MIKPLIHYFLQLIYPLFKKVLPYEVYAYLAVGAANTALNILIFAAAYQFFSQQEKLSILGLSLASYTISLVIAFIATVPSGFWLAKHFAFRQSGAAKGQTRKQLGKYILVVLQGLGTDYLLLIALILVAGFHPTLAKLMSTILVLTLNFLLQKYFTFRVKTA